MTHPPTHSGYYPSLAPPAPSNGLGTAGFIVSIVSLFTCGFLAPVSVILCFVAMRREPRGLAIAGLIISAIGTLLAVVVIAFPFYVHYTVRANRARHDLILRTASDVNRAVSSIQLHARMRNQIPTNEQGAALLSRHSDAWSRPFKFERLDDGHFRITSAGADGRFGTPDDQASGAETPTSEATPALPAGVHPAIPRGVPRRSTTLPSAAPAFPEPTNVQ